MFRPMRRIKQQLAEDEALEVLKSAKRGVLSVIGDDGWPYGIHLNPYWEDGRLYFHGAKSGHKIDALRRDARASFTVIDDGVKDDGGWAYTFRSVIVFGRVEFVDDQEKALEGGFVAGIALFGESASALRIASAALIVAGIVGLKLAR